MRAMKAMKAIKAAKAMKAAAMKAAAMKAMKAAKAMNSVKVGGRKYKAFPGAARLKRRVPVVQAVTNYNIGTIMNKTNLYRVQCCFCRVLSTRGKTNGDCAQGNLKYKINPIYVLSRVLA